MRVGIIGAEQSGKKTLFSILTGAKGASFSGKGDYPLGVGSVADSRVDRLAALYKPKKVKHAEIEWVLFPALPDSAKARDRWFDAARALDGLCVLIRQFGDASVYHSKGSVDPARDLQDLDDEMVFADLAMVETRIERLSRENVKKTAAEREKELEILGRLKEELEAGRRIAGLEITESEHGRLSGLKFLTRIGAFIAVNSEEGLLADEEKAAELARSLPSAGRQVVVLSAKLEKELAEIEDPAERAEFMKDLGVKGSASERLTQSALRAGGLISFLTVGPDEVRAWLVRDGALAAEAAGVIHSDLERGFIRAEKMDHEELLKAGSESKLKEQGKVALKGKDYAVRDGDILHILASA